MPKFRKRPVVIEASQFFPDRRPWPTGVFVEDSGTSHNPGVSYGIVTLEGRLHVTPGDWIITGVKGERYPCKPDIFEATYEAAE